MPDTRKNIESEQDLSRTVVVAPSDVTLRLQPEEKQPDDADDTLISRTGSVVPELSETKTLITSFLASFSDGPVPVDETIPQVSGPPLNWDTTTELFHSGLTDKYKILDRLGRGGQGTVDRALDLPLGRDVAIKTLHEEFLDDAKARAFFRQEAMITAQLDHPSIIPVYALCSDGKSCHIVMKLARGTSLEEVIQQTSDDFRSKKKNRFTELKDLRTRLEIFLAVCNAMEYAHSRHVLHRDLKPENIMTGAFHETYIMDWGLAEPFTPVDDSLPDPPNMSGTISGTPRYLPPEVIMKKQIDQRSDIFALGLILFELVTLKHAYEGASAEEVMKKILSGKMAPLTHKFKVPVDGDLKAIIRKACAVHRVERYKTVRKFADDLRRYIDGLEVSARPDNLPRKILRASVRHRVLLLISLLVLAVLLTLSAAHSFKTSWAKEQQERRRDEVLNMALSSCVEKSNRFSEQLIRMESAMEDLAGNAADMLADKDNPYLSGKNIPSSYVKEDKFVFKETECRFPAGIPEAEKRRLMRLFPMLARDIRNIASQANGRMLGNGDGKGRDDCCRKVYLTLNNGVRMGYPSWNVPKEGFDGRTRVWYKAAAKEPNRTVWSAPYADASLDKEVTFTLSRAIVHPETGELLGVVGADLSLRYIRMEITPAKQEASCISDRLLVNHEGKIMLSLDPEYKMDVLEDDSIRFPDVKRKNLAELFRGKNFFGYLTARADDGIEYVYLKAFIPGSRWYYIEKINLAALLAQEERKTAPFLPSGK